MGQPRRGGPRRDPGPRRDRFDEDLARVLGDHELTAHVDELHRKLKAGELETHTHEEVLCGCGASDPAAARGRGGRARAFRLLRSSEARVGRLPGVPAGVVTRSVAWTPRTVAAAAAPLDPAGRAHAVTAETSGHAGRRGVADRVFDTPRVRT